MTRIKIASRLIVAVALAGLAHAQVASTPDVRCDGGRLTLKAVDAQLKAVMDQIVERCGIEVVGGERLAGTVTATIEGKPVNEAIDVLLAGYNYLVGVKRNPETNALGWRVSVLSRIGAEPGLHKSNIVGPVHLPAIEAALQAEREMADPVDQEEQEEREANLAALTKDGAFLPDKAVSSLIDLYEEEDNPLVRRRVLFELDSRAPEKALPLLLEALADEDLNEEAIEILGRRKDPASLAQVGQFLVKELDLNAKFGAFRVLALRPDPSSVKYVERLVKHENQIVREAAAQFLAEMEQRRKAKEGR